AVGERDHVTLLERKIHDLQMDVEHAKMQRDEAVVELDKCKEDFREYDRKHATDMRDVEALAKKELEKVREQFAAEDAERAGERAEFEEEKRYWEAKMGDLKGVVERMEAEKQFSAAESARKVDSMKNLIGQDTSADFQCQKYYFLMWRYGLAESQRDHYHSQWQRLIDLNESRMANLCNMFSHEVAGPDVSGYFKRWKQYTEKHAGERRQLRITERQNAQVQHLMSHERDGRVIRAFFRQMEKAKNAARARRKLSNLLEKEDRRRWLGQWR
ncbi:unnamed protein product, partial [Amoebophrya sp. A25]